jgi:hypothetical protein
MVWAVAPPVGAKGYPLGGNDSPCSFLSWAAKKEGGGGCCVILSVVVVDFLKWEGGNRFLNMHVVWSPPWGGKR